MFKAGCGSNMRERRFPAFIPQVYMYVYMLWEPVGYSDVSQNENKALKGYDGRIIECFWDSRNTTWKFLRVREDKSYPNSHVTATSETLPIAI